MDPLILAPGVDQAVAPAMGLSYQWLLYQVCGEGFPLEAGSGALFEKRLIKRAGA